MLTAGQWRRVIVWRVSIGVDITGSGAIASAHRTVVQKRMNLSGQRWGIKGTQNMLNLRVTYMNEKRENIIQLVRTDFKQTG